MKILHIGDMTIDASKITHITNEQLPDGRVNVRIYLGDVCPGFVTAPSMEVASVIHMKVAMVMLKPDCVDTEAIIRPDNGVIFFLDENSK